MSAAPTRPPQLPPHVTPVAPVTADEISPCVKGTAAFTAFSGTFATSVWGISQLVKSKMRSAQVTPNPAVWVNKAQQVYANCFDFPTSDDPNAGLDACKQTQNLNTTAVCDWRMVRFWASRMNLTDCQSALATQLEAQAEKHLVAEQWHYYWVVLPVFVGACIAAYGAYKLTGYAGACDTYTAFSLTEATDASLPRSLLRSLHIEQSDNDFLRGDLSAFTHLDAAYAQSISDAERVGVELGRVSLLTALGRYKEAILVFSRGLKILHHTVRIGATQLDVGIAIVRLFAALWRKPIPTLAQRPMIADPQVILAIELCSTSGLAVYYASDNMKMIGAMLAARLTIVHGNSRLSGFAYAAMIIVTTQLSMYKLARRFGTAARQAMSRIEGSTTPGMVHFTAVAFLEFMRRALLPKTRVTQPRGATHQARRTAVSGLGRKLEGAQTCRRIWRMGGG